MTNDSSKSRQISKSYLLLIFALLCGTVFITIFFTLFCLSENEKIESDYFAKVTYTGEAIKNAIFITNNARIAYESRYGEKLALLLDDFQEEFFLAGGDPSQIDLEELKQKYLALHPEGISLYIIDDTTTIILSTDPEEIGYDFSDIPLFASRLSEIRLENEGVIDVASRNKFTRQMFKYGYIPSYDHEYLLELGIALPEVAVLEAPTYAGLDVNIITTPNTVFLFGSGAVILENPIRGLIKLGSYENVLTEFPQRLDYLSRAYATQESFSVYLPEFSMQESYSPYFPEQNKRVDYYFIPYSKDAPSYVYTSQVLEVTTDLTPLHLQILQNTAFFIILTVICDAVFISMILFIIWDVVLPINLINNDIEIIANGAYDHEIQQVQGLEFDRLQASITKMVSSLKDELEVNKGKTKQLDFELTQRKIVEKSLVNVTKKLNLLSSITRHDILNQVMVAHSLLDLMADEREKNCGGSCDNMHEDLFMQLYATIQNINKQIQFTRLYAQIGEKEPMWQPISSQIAEAERDLCYPPGIICNHVLSLHVLANPMFHRVIYNLLDNAKQYAIGMTSLVISFVEQASGEGLLTFEDNGPGVAYEKKNLIFERGYGLNTGFGLYLIREILSITDITIYETGIPGEGARFELHIPTGFWKFL